MGQGHETAAPVCSIRTQPAQIRTRRLWISACPRKVTFQQTRSGMSVASVAGAPDDSKFDIRTNYTELYSNKMALRPGHTQICIARDTGSFVCDDSEPGGSQSAITTLVTGGPARATPCQGRGARAAWMSRNTRQSCGNAGSRRSARYGTRIGAVVISRNVCRLENPGAAWPQVGT